MGSYDPTAGDSIQNTGLCPLNFRLSLTDVLEGDISRTQVTSPARFPKKRKGEAESGRATKAEFDDNLQPNEELAIFGGNLRRFENRGKFSFWNIDENMQLLVPERKTIEFGVRFQPVNERRPSDAAKETAPNSRKKKKEGKENADELKKLYHCHVAMVKLALGSSVLLDFIMICFVN
ncbi:uncharacterized protein LOC122528822 [Frieseomelitta varia]|uniref:uncharacterized protein LOC122528822 n=1 Tax=Frieseomelitta varia TaxID=561572 RepID=UPI001CB69C25|nr:uncharacterized protein LOC122528822 [Frieseomelitta varia]